MLIKIGLTLLPDDELLDYEIVRKMILYNEKDGAYKGHNMLTVYGYWYPGPIKFPTAAVELWTRRAGCTDIVPEKQVVLYYGNYVFQIALPFGKADAPHRGVMTSFPRYPLMVDQAFIAQTKGYKQAVFDFTNAHVVKGDMQSFEYHFECKQDLPINDAMTNKSS